MWDKLGILLLNNSHSKKHKGNVMLEKSNTLNLEQVKELKEPATRMGQLYDAMLVLQLDESIN